MSDNADQRLPFKQENSFEKRARLSAKIRKAHPDRVPIIVERHAKSPSIPEIQKRKFLSPGDISVAQFVAEIRRHIQMKPEETIWLFVNGSALPHSAATMSQVYEQHKDEDGFLYVVYSGQNHFGACN